MIIREAEKSLMYTKGRQILNNVWILFSFFFLSFLLDRTGQSGLEKGGYTAAKSLRLDSNPGHRGKELCQSNMVVSLS